MTEVNGQYESKTTGWWMLDDAECIPWLSFVAAALLLIVACRWCLAWNYIVHGEPPMSRIERTETTERVP